MQSRIYLGKKLFPSKYENERENKTKKLMLKERETENDNESEIEELKSFRKNNHQKIYYKRKEPLSLLLKTHEKEGKQLSLKYMEKEGKNLKLKEKKA